mmetsp:Transcript_62097/g.176408  ORF Transcript_62097/g.176408 Transcript_62097/m.176408 type:complete len:160 (+) Transcript_62097:73-552(+)
MVVMFRFQGAMCSMTFWVTVCFIVDTISDPVTMAPGASGRLFRALFASHGILSALVFILLIQEDDLDQLPLLRRIPKYLVTLQKPIECRLPCLRSKTILRLLSFYFSVGAWTRISTSTIPHYWFSIFLLGTPVHLINLVLFCCCCSWGHKEATTEKKDE